MLSQASTVCETGSIAYAGAKAERIPLQSRTVDCSFSSMVFHHLEDMDATCREIARVLRSDGVAFVRNSFSGRLDTVRHYPFFPSARGIDERRLPTVDRVVGSFRVAGMTLRQHCVVTQCIDPSLSAYCERMKQKALSTFISIPDEGIRQGIAAMEEAARAETDPKPIFEDTDLLVFGKRTSSAAS